MNQRNLIHLIWTPLCVFMLGADSATTGQAPRQATLAFSVSDQAGRHLPCRIHVIDAEGKPHKAAGWPSWNDHFVCNGQAELILPAGVYTYQIERGPEFLRESGTVEISPPGDVTRHVQLRRVANLNRDGWYSGDLHVHRPVDDIRLLMQAEDLNIAPVITWWNARNPWKSTAIPRTLLHRFDGDRFYQIMAGEDEREGGALMFFHLDRPLEITEATREYPSPLEFVRQAHQQNENVWIDIEKPFWWDVPAWLASGQMDSIGLANNHMCRNQMLANEAWGRPRDTNRLPDPLGNGFWTQEIYYHLLNCGLRLPPSAGSASGVLPNPVGYNRVYVHVEGDLQYDKWWDSLRAGRCFVTNGPLLRCKANGHLPGHVFRADDGAPLKLELDVSLISQDHVAKLEIIKNGDVDSTVKLDGTRTENQKAVLTFDDSGWFLVRAIADNANTFRFSSTAPFYVEIGPQPRRISRGSAQFFLDWAKERAKRVGLQLSEPEKLKEVLKHHEYAERFWQDVLARSNAE